MIDEDSPKLFESCFVRAIAIVRCPLFHLDTSPKRILEYRNSSGSITDQLWRRNNARRGISVLIKFSKEHGAKMFAHIPEEIFCPQVSGNINDALRVLKVNLEDPEKNSHFFDTELSIVDPENPVTQVSKTPSDEEFPWCGEDTDADIPSTAEDQDQLLRPMPVEELALENSGDERDDQASNDPEVQKDKEERQANDTFDALQETKEIKDFEAEDEDAKAIEKKDIGEDDDGQNLKEKPDDQQEEDGRLITETRTPNELEIPKLEEIDKEQETSPGLSQLDDAEREKREKEEKMLEDYKNLAFPKRPRSMIKTELLVKDVKRFIEDMKKQTAPEDLDIRIIPSNMACRFELPIDLTRLKGECPMTYLRKYCRVTDSRQAVYKEKFKQFQTEQAITVSSLRKIYENLYRESPLRDEVMHLQRLLGLDLSMELDIQTFTVVSCLMERIMLKSQGRGPAQGYKKNVFEVTNFSALNGKLQGIEISPQMMDLLKYIRST